ncbi:chromosome transmission fidelity protein 18 homolog [Rhinatrema bivittatum]|uniref:chromosome transmission fidelity protein 18 homolog n=1 Tax=Rhinatrema bivittatum TaxID=194408 RepID=UPI00112C4284|nr:chromosome transmission fidelity protein 18 homolog [Rhinatrema bivittatum]
MGSLGRSRCGVQFKAYPEVTERAVLARAFRNRNSAGARSDSRARAMDEYGELYGVEDDFESQFAAELEVLAELEDEGPQTTKPKTSQFRNKRSFEEAIAAGDVWSSASVNRKTQQTSSSDNHTKFTELTPKHKRPKLEAVKKLDFGVDDLPILDFAYVNSSPPPPEQNSKMQSTRSTKFLSSDALEISDLAPLEVTPTEEDRKRVLKRPPVLEEYVHVTSTEGSRVYMALKEDHLESRAELFRPGGLGWNAEHQLHLLGVPFSYLKEQVGDQRRKQILEESQQLTEFLNSHMDDGLREAGNEPEPTEAAGDEEEEDGDEATSHCLWVDRFTPRHYTELLSDDYTNRCLLKWLKLWDPVVFGKEKTARKLKPSTETGPPLKHQQKEQQGKWKSKEQITEEILEAELDQHKRPKYKVALLCGPPGLGKTTLAHVIAKHAGYNVVEMNASDDRSPDVFKTRIEAATQMKSVLGVHEQPNCLIIDEIDGAPTVAINMLLSLVNRKNCRETEPGTEAEGGGSGAKKKKKEGGLLLRPIVCICNDQFVPALRQLRQQAFLLRFPQTLPSRLVQRLYEISTRKGMKAETGALMALCEKTENDIRSCLNTLQFLHGRGKMELNMRMVQTMSIGVKDQNKGLFSVWQEIFQLPKMQRKRIGQDLLLPNQFVAGSEPAGTPLSAASQRFHRILHVTASTGEHEKLTQGLYDNFLNMKVKDASLGTVCLALDWLEFSDLVNEVVMHGQNFQLMRYLPFLPVAFHLLFAASSVPRISYPNSHFEAQTKLNQMQNLLNSMVCEINPSIRSRVGPRALVLETLCLLLDVISPKLRPVNIQLYSLKEKQQLADLINTMLSYNLTYHQERTPDGQYVYKLDPNVEDVCRFPNLPTRKQLTYQAKQLISREIELEKMRRIEALRQARTAGWAENSTEILKSNERGQPKSSIRNHEQRLENIVKKAAFQEKPETDFFGRPLIKKMASSAAAKANPECELQSIEKRMGKAVGRSDVWFRFNEGMSNAVRRSLYVKDLL